ncbi:MAG: hypothetical protein K8J31_25540 [Anaerolineae bacterium]|nr:hypothetical protein [Anaerolineae bacterium]
MTSFPRSPKIIKGAIIGIDPFNPLASVIIFQYNPDTLRRTVTASTSGEPDRGEALRLKGPPTEKIDVEIEIDATDQLESSDPLVTAMGIYPALSSLEMLLYPKSALVIANEVLATAGVIEVIPPEAPLTLFIWGVNRILPVRITELSITEEAYDTLLNPIRAKISLQMRVLNYHDLGITSVGGALSLVNQIAKEVMATIGSVGNIAANISF